MVTWPGQALMPTRYRKLCSELGPRGMLAEGGGSAEAADTFDSGDEGASPSLELEARRLESLRKTVHVGRAHSLKPIAAEGPKLQRLTEAEASEARQDDPTPGAEEGPAGPVETYTKVQLQEQLAALQFKFTQQLGEATLQLQQKVDQLAGDFQKLQESHQRLEQDVAHERAQQVQQQLALQTEMRATGDRVSQETISTVERLDRGARQANMFVSGVVMPAGGKGQLVRHVEQLFHQHAEVPRGAISDVTCVGPHQISRAEVCHCEIPVSQGEACSFSGLCCHAVAADLP